MIITTTGFFNTGSSVITNILQEMGCIGNKDDVYELRILYDPDCISDLEFNLIENPHRQNTSYAIKRFKRYVDKNSNPLFNHHYEKICNGYFKIISYEYINNISDFTFSARSHLECFDKGVVFNLANRVYMKAIRTIFKSGVPQFINPSLLSNNITQYAGTLDCNLFFKETKEYINRIIAYCNPEDKDYVMIDQLVPPTNVSRYLNYLPDNQTIRVFIVDRDPRDLYFTCKYFLNSKAIPCQEPATFCRWYKWTREQSHVKDDPNCVMRIQFEDLIYKYEITRKKVLSFCGIEDCNCTKKSIFNPELSIQNTQVWLRFPEYSEELAIIEDLLSKYCYDFSSSPLKPDLQNGKMFDC